MIALVMFSGSFLPAGVFWLGVLAFLASVFALMTERIGVKRSIGVAVLALVLTGGVTTLWAEDFVCATCQRCKDLGPGDWEYWLIGCWQF